MKRGLAWTGGVLVFLIVSAAVVLGGWQAGWWFTFQNANRNAQVIQNGFNYQSTLYQQVTKGIAQVTTDTTEISQATEQGKTSYANQLKAQREADANTVCQQATQVNVASTVFPAATLQWINANCSAGSVSPNSVFYYVGG